MKIRMSNDNCTFQWNLDGISLRASMSGQIGVSLGTVHTFALQALQKDGTALLLIDEHLMKTDQTTDRIMLTYQTPLAQILVTYRLLDAAVIKQITVVAQTEFKLTYATTFLAECGLPLSRGGEGQPVFLGDRAFVASMLPVSSNQWDANRLYLSQAPFALLQDGMRFELAPVVLGLSSPAGLEETVRQFVRSRRPHEAKPLRIYCDWGAHDELSDAGAVPLSEAMCNRILDQLEQAKKESQVVFDWYLMDAFWFDPALPYTAFRADRWPNGPDLFIRRVQQAGMSFGLWFDLNMAFVEKNPDWPRRSRQQKELCLSSPENMDRLFETVDRYLRDHQVRMLKFDFAFFACEDPSHSYHSTRPDASKEPAVRMFMEHLDKLREHYPDLLVLAYNGFTTGLSYIGSVDPNRTGYAISPWWCTAVDYLYCGDPRPSEIPTKELSSSLLYYSDSMVEQFHDALVPYEAIDDHGTMVGQTATIYNLGKTCLRDSVIMNLSRGGRKIHFYGEPGLLDHADWSFLHDVSELWHFVGQKDNKTSALPNTVAGQGVYGYSNTTGDEGYFTLVNSDACARTADVCLLQWDRGDSLQIRCCYAHGEYRPLMQMTDSDWQTIGCRFSCRMEAQEIMVFHWRHIYSAAPCGYLYMDGNQTICFDLPGQAKTLALCMVQDNLSPIRSTNDAVEAYQITIQGTCPRRLQTMPIWSGISWQGYEIGTTDKSCTVCLKNQTAQPVTLRWQIL